MSAAVKTFGIGKFDLNPRGNLWVKDESKFGQRLLSRMGWNQGKGLGKHEDGTTEFVKVRMKVGHSGVGFTEKLPLDAYNEVLESLNKTFKTNDKTKKVGEDFNGLEQRSQQFKKRLHYQKFVRGKDVGRYSEKDMNSIFVTRKPDPAAAPLKANITSVDSALPEISAPELLSTFKSQLSMSDYFAMKLNKKLGEVPSSNICTSDSQQTNSTCFENGIASKKRKREQKNNTKTSKRLKSKQVDTSEEGDTSTKELTELPTEVKVENRNRKSKWAGKLKSCLKSKLPSGLWFKQEPKEVSFNDTISCKIIESVLNQDIKDDRNQAVKNVLGEYVENVLGEDFLCNTEHHPYGLEEKVLEEGECVDDENKLIVESTVDEDNCHLKRSNDNFDPHDDAESRIELKDIPKCLDLPKCNHSNYNTWLESQRIAIKMKLYKNMVKKIRKNPIFRTSNILDLKGYGNLGF